MKSIGWSINFNLMKHKQVYCLFLESASYATAVGINKNEINPECQTNFTTL